MASRYDIALQDDEPIFANGDFTTGISDQQHIKDTINAFPSWWKQFPQDGAGIRSWIGAPGNKQELQKIIRIQLVSDGYTVTNPVVTLDVNGNLTVEPNATI